MILDPLSFSHGQTQSKIWLCEELEPLLPENAVVGVLGCWHNLQAFLLASRKRNTYKSILGADIDSEAIRGANTLCQGYMIGDDSLISNVVADVNTYDFRGFSAVINASVEHMSNEWFDNLTDSNTIICVQSSTVAIAEEPWFISNPSTTFAEFEAKFPMSEILYSGSKRFDYGTLCYDRMMLIGKK